MSDIKERLDILRGNIQEEDFLLGKGLSNEVNIRMFCYDAKDEMIVQHFVEQLYSLAGLFALWTAYETDIFSAIASCSGSLWFEQWDEYVLHHQIKHKSNIYLSLGGKEEKTKNPVMARVGDRTRIQERILRNDPKVKQTTLEFNSGGHFADAQKRLAKAVKWLLECT